MNLNAFYVFWESNVTPAELKYKEPKNNTIIPSKRATTFQRTASSGSCNNLTLMTTIPSSEMHINNLYLNVIADQAESDSTDVSSRKDTTRFKVRYFPGSALVLVTQTSSPSIYPHLSNLKEGWLSLSWTSEPWS